MEEMLAMLGKRLALASYPANTRDRGFCRECITISESKELQFVADERAGDRCSLHDA